MTLYIIAKIYYKDLIDKLDVIYNKPNLFSNAENHFLFIKSNTLQIFLPKFYELKISDKYLIPENYIFNISKSYHDAISLIMENLTKNKYDKIKFIVPSIYPYKLQIALFHYFFHIKDSIIYYQNKFHELSNNEIIEMFDLKKGYNGIGRKLFFEEIEKEMKLKLLDKIISNLFMQKSTYTQNINLPYLFFDNDLKKSLISNDIKKGVNEFNNDFYLYKVNKIQNKNIYFIENIYSFLDKFDDIYLDVNNSKYFDLNIGKIVLLENQTYYSKENFMTLDSVKNSNKKLCEFFKYYDYFSFEQMLYTIYELEEYVRTNLDDEIIEYTPISLDFDIIDFTNKLLNENNLLKVLKEINGFPAVFKEKFKYLEKPIYKCPFCIDGQIYSGKHTYFCNNCDFVFYKESNRYNLKINKRIFKLLLKYKKINLIYNGKLSTFILKKGKKWYNIVKLKD